MHGQSCVNLIAVGSCQIELPNCEIILREDQGPSRIEHLFLGYGDKWPRKWLGIGGAFSNVRQCTANALPMQFDMFGLFLDELLEVIGLSLTR